MRVVVASTVSPFQDGVTPAVATELAASLRNSGHEVEEVRLPLDVSPERVVEQTLAIRLTDISHAGELMISVGWLSHLLEHPSKLVWFQSDALELARVPPQSLSAHRAALTEARSTFSCSAAVSERVRGELGIETEVLAPPAGEPEGWTRVLAELLR